MKLQSLTNVRPTADLGCQLIATPTKGNFRLTPEASAKIGVADGDYLKVVKDIEDPKNVVVYLTKGSYSEEAGAEGSKLASTNGAGGGTLQFSAAAAWQDDLDGYTDGSVHYNVGEPVEFEGMLLYPLEFDKKEAKTIRKSAKEKAASNDTNVVEQEVQDVQEVQEVQEEEDEFMNM